MHDERRAHERHAANLETTCQLVNSEGPGYTIRVRDVSRGGINFLIEREVAPGTLVRVALPRPAGAGESTMLACVMHCTPQTAGGFAIGCAFSDELGDDEMHEFGARREPAHGRDKRVWTRFPAHGVAEYIRLPPNGQKAKQAQISNVSPTGIGLLLDERIEPGVVLDLLLKTKSGNQFDILACVVYLGTREGGGWVAGCHFIRELDDSDLKAIL